MKKCIIIGGGISGLATGVYLSEKGADVLLLEASPKLGGRAYSLEYNGNFVDNGQHILMGCYNNTLSFLDKIGTLDKLDFQGSLSIKFIDRSKKKYELKSDPHFPYPINLLIGLFNYKALSFNERIRLLKFFFSLYFLDAEKLKNISVEEWLRKNNQSQNIIKCFWQIIIEGTLNTSIKDASAKTLAIILKQMFFNGGRASNIIVPKVSLSHLYVDASSEFITNNGGKVHLSERVIQVKTEGEKVIKIITDKNEYADFDYAVLAIPPHMLLKLFSEQNSDLNKVEYSSITSLHLWLNENPFTENFYGLIDSPVQWIFNKGNYISTVTSNSDALLNLSHDQIITYFINEIEEYFPFKISDKIVNSKLIREKRATFIPGVEIEKVRAGFESKYTNLIYSGDFSRTNLPSTIEGAVKSGITSANLIMKE
ncbi:MAG: FAD-dependent oxidoreductase [Melioribacteraceae bacterium]|nr:FAD-dependent oxidoreductase [Melioribacteraceae bacterium]